MSGIIYKATAPDGRVYIGQTTQTLAKRKAAHAFRAKMGDKRSPFQAAILGHGFSSFIWEQIDAAADREELDAKERYWIAHYDSMNPAKGYNSTDGGIRYLPSAETRRRNSEAHKGLQAGENHPMYGKRHTAETRKKMSEALRGEKHHAATITEATARAIKTDLQAGMRICKVMRKYGVTKSVVANIKYGFAWAWATGAAS